MHNTLTSLGIKTDWLVYEKNHSSGSDMLGLSLKCNKIYCQKVPHTILTSYRTTTYKTWEDKKRFVELQDEGIKGYLFNVRIETPHQIKYSIYFIQKKQNNFLDLNSYKIKIKGNNREISGKHPNGTLLNIYGSTSGQLIFKHIPLASLDKYHIINIRTKRIS